MKRWLSSAEAGWPQEQYIIVSNNLKQAAADSLLVIEGGRFCALSDTSCIDMAAIMASSIAIPSYKASCIAESPSAAGTGLYEVISSSYD